MRSKFYLQTWKSFIFQRKHFRDIIIILVLGILGSLASYFSSQCIDSVIFVEPKTMSKWFQADIPRVFANMTTRLSNHYRVKVHPLFSLIAFPPVYVLKNALGIAPLTAVRLVIALVASFWVSTLFTVLRLIGCRLFDAILFSILGATSASAIFWFSVPETHSFGSLSILLALGFVALTQHYTFSSLWYISVNALTLSFTVTNWMIGIFVTLINHRWRQFWRITVATFCLVTVLWGVEKFIFPSAVYFLNIKGEKKFLLTSASKGPLHVIKSFIYHTMVMPAIEVVADPMESDWPVMLTQASSPGSGSFWGIVAIVLWSALLVLGLWGLFSVIQHIKVRTVLGLTLLGQLVLHILYGEETFLYSLHFAPLLVVLAALSTLTRARLLSLLLAGMLVLCAGINNGLQFLQATTFFRLN